MTSKIRLEGVGCTLGSMYTGEISSPRESMKGPKMGTRITVTGQSENRDCNSQRPGKACQILLISMVTYKVIGLHAHAKTNSPSLC